MSTEVAPSRSTSFAQVSPPTIVDRAGRWLSSARIRRLLGDVSGRRAADIGCGYDAGLSKQLFASAGSLLLVDVRLDPSLAAPDRVTLIEGELPGVLASVPDESLDVVICNNVIEHLWEPLETLRELHRITAPRGTVVVNVPSWRGKFFLEVAAFRLGVSPREEMEDHKTYFDPQNLWPLLRRAGFMPSDVSCRTHKFGLNTIARCRRA